MDVLPKDLRLRVQNASRKHPCLEPLFVDIAAYIGEQINETGGQQAPTSKKRKLEPDDSRIDDSQVDSFAEVSFSIPQRKKLKLELSRNVAQGTVRGTSSTAVEFWLRWKDIQYCICVPVPEKAQPQYNFCVIPKSSNDQMLFTLAETKIKPELVSTDTKADPEETYKSLCIKLLNKRLHNKVMEPDEREFVSQVAQAQRKGAKAVHIKAFLGNKDGFLFLLPHGILWAFKKPLSFYPFSTIHSVSYTSILQRTFNLTISVLDSPGSPSDSHKEIEFSMIDQIDFQGIDAYVKRHGLNDASMAEQRRAKKLNINGVKGEVGGDGSDEQEGELEKAVREAEGLQPQEEEDEDEEDDENFDPGSEGESEGSGTESEDGDGDGGRSGEEEDDDSGSE